MRSAPSGVDLLKQKSLALDRICSHLHDLNNVMLGLVGYVDIFKLDAQGLDPEQAELLGRIKAGADSLYEIVSDMNRIKREFCVSGATRR
jgi:signal transduction histidine kinase